MNKPKQIWLVGTYHAEFGAVTVPALLEIPDRIKPEVVFAEMPQENVALSGTFRSRSGKLEQSGNRATEGVKSQSAARECPIGPPSSTRRPESRIGSGASATIDGTPIPNLKGAGMTSSEQAQGESLTSKVSGWLEKQGYPLEMRVARVLQEEGAHVVQSDYYTDRATGASREIDVVATWDIQVEDVIVRINFTIECKGTRHKPWVMFVSDGQRLGSVASVAQRASSGIGGAALWHMADERNVQNLALFRLPRLCGYSLAPMQDRNNEKDECFTALTGVAAATAAQAAMPDFQDGRSGTINILEVIFPIIVTDAPLCAARLNQKSEIVVEEARSGVVLWRNPVVGFPHTLVHVVTGQEFDSFATKMADSVVKFLKMCEGPMLPHVHKAVAEVRQARVLTSRKSLGDILR